MILNIDYKILTSCLSAKMITLLLNLIDDEQVGYMPNQYIEENHMHIQSLIDFVNNNKLAGIIMFIDFEKAYDSVHWKFLIESLRYFNFGDRFIK